MNTYRVQYHFEKGGIRCSDTQADNVLAASLDGPTLIGILTSNGRTNNNIGTLVIEDVRNVSVAVQESTSGPGTSTTASRIPQGGSLT